MPVSNAGVEKRPCAAVPALAEAAIGMPSTCLRRHKFYRAPLLIILLALSACPRFAHAAERIHHYVFFNRDRERIEEKSFLNTPAFEGAQIKYAWKQLEPAEGEYDFEEIRHDLEFLHSKDKRLFMQIQDASFDPSIILVPKYLQTDPKYHRGADEQFAITGDDEVHATPAGWVARRWDPAVRERFHKLLNALGEAFDGKIEGINLPETAVDFGETGRLYPKGFTPEIYQDAVISNMRALARAFPKSVKIQYANFMPETKGDSKHASLRRIYEHAAELGVGMGGPDLLPYKPGQMRDSYPLLKEFAGRVPTAIAVQDGNYAHILPRTAKQVTIPELIEFAREYLSVRYVFWCTEEPYYSRDLIPYLQGPKR